MNGACRNTEFVSLGAPARHLMMYIKLFAICQLPRNLSFETSKTPFFYYRFLNFFQVYIHIAFQLFNIAP